MIILTEEQVQQIEEVLECAIGIASDHNRIWLGGEKALAIIRAARAQEQAEPEQYPTYGFCPICGSRGISRERRINGNDTCANRHSYASNLALHIAPEKQAEQEPVAYFLDVEAGFSSKPLYEQVSDEYKNHADVFPLYAAPVRTKDLTDDEIADAFRVIRVKESWSLDFARAVIAKFKEKNK